MMDSLLKLISNIALYLNFSVIFSITLLCVILYLRTKDKTISFFLGMLIAQVLLFSIGLLYHYILQAQLSHLFENYTENLAFLSVILICLIMTTVIYMTVRYTLYLIPLEEKRKRLGIFLSTVVSGVFLLFSLFTVIIVTKDEWAIRAEGNLNFLFLLGSLILIAPSIVALIYHGRSEGEKKSLLKGIVFSFLPIAIYFPIDLLLLRESPFKITHIAYTVFAITLFMYIMKQYMKEYEISDRVNEAKIVRFNKKYGISEREAEIIHCLVVGKTNKVISGELFISVNTIKSHIKNIYGKLSVSNRIQLIHKIHVESEE
ncbi:MAG: helix-turn-helix transcriptional regulator [Clostridia bacterium]